MHKEEEEELAEEEYYGENICQTTISPSPPMS